MPSFSRWHPKKSGTPEKKVPGWLAPEAYLNLVAGGGRPWFNPHLKRGRFLLVAPAFAFKRSYNKQL
jgi:hypothetical protein